MSADNMAICPHCDKERESKIQLLSEQVSESYGKVSQDVYEKSRKELREFKSKAIPYNLREDCEIGILGGKFKIKYHAQCSKCEFSYGFSHSEQTWRKK